MPRLQEGVEAILNLAPSVLVDVPTALLRERDKRLGIPAHFWDNRRMRVTYPPPANEQDFERLSLELLRVHCDRPHLELYAHRGEAQHGIDIYDTAVERPAIGAQCKLHRPSLSLTSSEVWSEIEKARSFGLPLDHFVILTTGKRSARAQQAVALANEDHRKRGLFLVELMTWDRIEELLQQYPGVGKAFYRTLATDAIDDVQGNLFSIHRSLADLEQSLSSRSRPAPLMAALREFHTIGGLGGTALRGEFLSTRDLIVWQPADDDGADPVVALFRYSPTGYTSTTPYLEAVIPFATRIHAVSDGLLVIQERSGVAHVSSSLERVTRGFEMPILDDPIIRAETVHPTSSVVVVGTDYGTLRAWDWRANEVLFTRRYFPRGDIVWMNALTIDVPNEVALFAVNDILYAARLTDGDIVSELPLGMNQEVGALALAESASLLAVGGVMDTSLYQFGSNLELVDRIPNRLPLVNELRFSPDGRLLAVLSGMGIGGTSLEIFDTNTSAVIARHGSTWPPTKSNLRSWLGSQVGSVTFSKSGDLIAVGEGDHVGVYRRPVTLAPT